MISVPCNLCGQDNWTIRHPATLQDNDQLDVSAFRCTNPGYGSHAQIVTCNQCGLVYANPRWSEEELVSAYTAVTDTTYVEEREGRELTFNKHLQDLEKHTGPANGRDLLDVGAYIGVFVEVASASGWNACGIEPSEWGAREAQKQGIHVIQGTMEAPELQGQQFDVITLWDVIEHVANPLAELQKAYDLLRPNGLIAVHTMNIDSLTAKLMGSRWPWFMDMHLTYFSQVTLSAMLQKAGYDIVWSGTQGRYLRMGYLASRLGGLNQSVGKLANYAINGLNLRETAVPVNFGDLFTVYARKPNA